MRWLSRHLIHAVSFYGLPQLLIEPILKAVLHPNVQDRLLLHVYLSVLGVLHNYALDRVCNMLARVAAFFHPVEYLSPDHQLNRVL